MRRHLLPLLVAVGMGVLLAAVTYRALPPERVPVRVIGLVQGGEVTALDIEGGARIAFHTEGDLETVAAMVEARSGLPVRAGDDLIEVDFPGLSLEEARRLVASLGVAGSLEFKVVESDTELMKSLYRAVELDGDPLARELEVRGGHETWVHDETGTEYEDYYLVGPSREAIERYIDERDAVPGEGLELGFELITWTHSPDRGLVRSYLLQKEAEVGSRHVADATVVFNPTTVQPEVLVELTEEGAMRFGELTSENVGNKFAIVIGDAVNSAPTIQAAILGGRTTITVGAGTVAEREREAAMLADALVRDPSPIPLEVAHEEVVSPSLTPAQLRGALATFAGAIGLGAALLMFLAGRAGPRLEPTIAPRPGAGLWLGLRALVTAGAIAAIWLMPRIVLPGVNPDQAENLAYLGNAPELLSGVSVFALGLAPILAAFVVVELVALAVPRWRRHRIGGPAGRARLAAPVAWLAVLFALAQGWLVASSLEEIGRDLVPFIEQPLVSQPGLLFRIIAALSLAAGALTYVVLASLIDRYGLANGYSVILAVGFFAELMWVLGEPMHSGLEVIAVALAIAGAAAATSWLLRIRIRSGEHSLRVPTCGVVPVAAYAAVAVVFEAAAFWEVDLPLGKAWADPAAQGGIALAATVAAAFAFSWLFSRPQPIAVGPARIAERKGASAGALWGASTLSAGYVALLVGLDLFLARVADTPPFIPLAAAIATSVAMDLLTEARARARRNDLVDVWPLHRVQVVDTAMRALQSAGIDVHARGAHHRTMLYFFGPFIPITLMVPHADAERARELLASLFGQATPEPQGRASAPASASGPTSAGAADPESTGSG